MEERQGKVEAAFLAPTTPDYVFHPDGSMGCGFCWYECPCPDKCRENANLAERTQNMAHESANNPPSELP